MKRLAALAVLSLIPCIALAAPIPKTQAPETEAQKNSKLRAYYDQLQRDLGDTAEGYKLRTEVDQTNAMAENMVFVEEQLFQARLGTEEADRAEAQALERFCQRLYQMPRSPREKELFQLSLWEARKNKKPRP